MRAIIHVPSALLAIALFALPAWTGPKTVSILSDFDVDSGMFVYCDVSTPVPRITCETGMGDDDGYIRVVGDGDKEVIILVTQLALASGNIEFQVEGRTQLKDGSFVKFNIVPGIDKDVASDLGQFIRIPEVMDEIRVGVRIEGTDDVPDTGATAEKVTVVYDAF